MRTAQPIMQVSFLQKTKKGKRAYVTRACPCVYQLSAASYRFQVYSMPT